ncbi:MAG: DUF814 domain-containing protein [Spirochaetales bacterium]|nr:DUF814 domain-containing protein [Spirochaetales bacterium]
MSLNYKEIELILSESHLDGAKIQGMVQSSFHSVTWELYDRERSRFLFYTEIGTPQSRLHVLSPGAKAAKTKKLQRFEQYARKNLEGSVIVSCTQLPFDRAVVWDLDNHGRRLKVYFRFYSGPGANIIVTDENNVIQDLLLRRPGRDEMSSLVLKVEERTSSEREFSVRKWSGSSFSAFIERTCAQEEAKDLYGTLLKQVQARMEHELGRLAASIRSSEKTLEANKDYAVLLYQADLLSANSYLIKRGADSVTVTDWGSRKTFEIALDKALTPGANVQACYDRYQKAKGAYENASAELERLRAEYASVEARFAKAMEDTGDEEADIRRLKSILDKTAPVVQVQTGPGIRTTSGGFQIIAGRNAKENDELLRHFMKGNDMWMHTRDFPGGYVFIKFRRDKSIPLEVLLDAANIAVLYSKGRNNSSVDLYYTQVKYLRRVKDGKTGLVIPTQEKNLTIKPEPARIARLLPKEET